MKKILSLLKPCPFCNEEAEIEYRRYTGTMASGMEAPSVWVRCKKNCASLGGMETQSWEAGKGYTDQKEKADNHAINLWNTRHYPKEVTDVLEAAKDAAKFGGGCDCRLCSAVKRLEERDV